MSVLSLSHTPTASTITKWVLCPASGVTAADRYPDHARAAALHLLEIALRADHAQEEQALQRLDVGAGGDHIHRHGDARVVGVAEAGDQVFGLLARGAVGDLLAELVALAELLPDDLDDVFGVRIILGEDQRLGHFRAPGEDLGKQPVPKGLDHRADLVLARPHPGRAGWGRTPGLRPAAPSARRGSSYRAYRHNDRLPRCPPRLRDPGADAVDLIAHVDAIGHGPLVGVLGDQVLVEEAQRVLGGRGRQADQEGIEILQHLPPQIVDRAVALVGDDEIDRSRWGSRGCIPRPLGVSPSAASELQLEHGRLFILFLVLFPLEHRIQPLDGGDGHLADRVDHIGRQPLDVVQLGELAPVIRGDDSPGTHAGSACPGCCGPPGTAPASPRRT